MKKPPRISEAEWEVMEQIWQAPPATVAKLCTAFAATRQWAPNTIRTLLTRLVGKGVLRHESRKGVHEYHPLIEREACVKEEVDSLLKRLFDGSLQPLLVHFVERRKLTPEQARQLHSLLEEQP